MNQQELYNYIAQILPGVRKQAVGGSDGDAGYDTWIDNTGFGGDRRAMQIEDLYTGLTSARGNIQNGNPGMNLTDARMSEILKAAAEGGFTNFDQIRQYLTPEENQEFSAWKSWVDQENAAMDFGDYLAMGTFMAGTAALGGAAFGGFGTPTDAAWGVNPATAGAGEFSLSAGLPANAGIGGVGTAGTGLGAASGGAAGVGLTAGAGASTALLTPAITGGATGLATAGTTSIFSKLANMGLGNALDLGKGVASMSGPMGNEGAAGASATQAGAAQAGIGVQQEQFDAMVKLLQPYVQAGGGALEEQLDLMGLSGPDKQRLAIAAIQASPEYASTVQQGENSLLQSASASGNLRGGNLQSALAKFRPAALSALIEQQMSRLGGITKLGQASSVGQANNGLAVGSDISALLQQQGAAVAGGQLATGNTGRARFGNVLTGAGIIGGAF